MDYSVIKVQLVIAISDFKSMKQRNKIWQKKEISAFCSILSKNNAIYLCKMIDLSLKFEHLYSIITFVRVHLNTGYEYKQIFKNVTKIVLRDKKVTKTDSVIVVAQRMQCRTTHKRKDC